MYETPAFNRMRSIFRQSMNYENYLNMLYIFLKHCMQYLGILWNDTCNLGKVAKTGYNKAFILKKTCILHKYKCYLEKNNESLLLCCIFGEPLDCICLKILSTF